MWYIVNCVTRNRSDWIVYVNALLCVNLGVPSEADFFFWSVQKFQALLAGPYSVVLIQQFVLASRLLLCCEEIFLSLESVKPKVLVYFWAPVAWSDMHYGFTSENSVHNHQSSLGFSTSSEWEIDLRRVLLPTLFTFLRVSSAHNRQIFNK